MVNVTFKLFDFDPMNDATSYGYTDIYSTDMDPSQIPNEGDIITISPVPGTYEVTGRNISYIHGNMAKVGLIVRKIDDREIF